MNFDKENNFNLLRLLAAMQVMFGHITFWLKLPIYHNTFTQFIFYLPGVPIFFTISGFLIANSYLRNGKNLKNYFISRGLRIYPLLWLVFILIGVLYFATGAIALHQVFSRNFILYTVGHFFTGSMFYSHILTRAHFPYSLTHFYKTFPMHVTWSITVEIGFYFLIPVLLVFYGTKNRLNLFRLIFWSFFAFSFTLSQFYKTIVPLSSPWHNFLNQNIFAFLWMFQLGIICYLNWSRVRRFLEGKAIFWIAAYFSYLLVIIPVFHYDGRNYMSPHWILSSIQSLLLCGMTLSLAFSFKGLKRYLSHFYHNDYSYGLYLFHMPIVFTLYFAGIVGNALLLPLVYAAAFTCAALSWFLLERRALLLKSRLTRRAI